MVSNSDRLMHESTFLVLVVVVVPTLRREKRPPTPDKDGRTRGLSAGLSALWLSWRLGGGFSFRRLGTRIVGAK